VREVGAIGLTVGDLDCELMFYTNTLKAVAGVLETKVAAK